MKRNKLIGTIAIVCVVAICATLLAGCGKLDKPEGIKYSSGTFSWDAVEDADGYMIHVNDADEFYITSTSLSANDSRIKGSLVDKQVNTLYVKAVTVNEEGKVNKKSKVVKYEFDYVYVAPATNWTVTLDLNYTDAPEAQTIPVKGGETFDKPTDPQRFGWTFDGWYRDKQCLVEAEFTEAGKSDFTVTANTTLYAKWSKDNSVTTTSVYFYSETWSQIWVKPSKGETALYEGEGIAMAAVPALSANWYKADIDDTATSVIFTNGTDSTESATFDKTTPYYKDGVWTAALPTVQPDEPDSGVYIKVNNGTAQQLSANPETEGEYMINVMLEVGDTVVITIDGTTVSNYDPECKFTGTATTQGRHSFYVSAEKIWVTVPQAPVVGSTVVLVINGDTSKAVTMQKNESPDNANVTEEYSVKVNLKANDTVKILEGDEFEFKNYEPGCKFNGTATVDGEYTFYAKKYQDGGDSVWVEVPENYAPATVKVYYHNSGWDDKWSEPTAYCWKTGTTNPNWPGEAMTALGDGWFVIEIDAGLDNIIFVGAEGNKTGDLKLVATNGVAYYNYNGPTDLRPAE